MGVLGLTPFLQRTCPEVIKVLPDRLRSLSGKRVVIDGTLITQRFHFAPLPHQFRHVLGWYRLVKHLRASDVQVLCVFDGKERSIAKEQEVDRRRRDRMLTAARGLFEVDRLARLRQLATVLQTWRTSGGTPEAAQTLSSLQHLMRQMKASAYPALSQPRDSAKPLDFAASSRVTQQLPSTGDIPFISHLEPRRQLHPDILRLFGEYRHSIPRILSLTESSPLSTAPVPSLRSATTPEEAEDARIDYDLSKSQHDLITEEGKLWEQLAKSNDIGAAEGTIISLAETLEAKSSALSESYARRTFPPTSETYHQSREILQAMGVPCIEPVGPFEAEALASSLVIHGYADYVASEDTDVLVYEAPLVRNIASSTSPLLLISGADVRAALGLVRARFVDFALLLGTDFSQRIKSVGPARALKFIREYGSIESILQHEPQYPPRVPVEQYLEQIRLARLVFRTLPPPPDEAQLEQRAADERAVWEIMDKYGLYRYVADDWEYGQALAGNYFSDNPAAA